MKQPEEMAAEVRSAVSRLNKVLSEANKHGLIISLWTKERDEGCSTPPSVNIRLISKRY